MIRQAKGVVASKSSDAYLDDQDTLDPTLNVDLAQTGNSI